MRRHFRPALLVPFALVVLLAFPALVSRPGAASPTSGEGSALDGGDLSVGAGDVAAAPAAAGAAGDPAAGDVAAAPAAGVIPAVRRAPAPLSPSSPRYREAPPPAPASELTGYEWPLRRGRITVDFGSFMGGTRVVDGRRFHDGLDIASFCGDRVAAAHDGIVLAAGRRFDDVIGWLGNLRPYYERLDAKGWWGSLPITVVIDDGNGYRSMYAHLARATVTVGQRVRVGQLIGYEGATGNATGCHLHYGLFSPLETASFAIRADVVKRLATPSREIARVDPATVLPPPPSGITIGWGVSGIGLKRPPARLILDRSE
jgi:murein DD-endopeptidase MepM/ murein hydrolase activator NlpD